MNSATTLSKTRVWALWVALASTAVLLAITLITTWGGVSTWDEMSYEQNAWGKLQSTFSMTLLLSAVALLVLLVASRIGTATEDDAK